MTIIEMWCLRKLQQLNDIIVGSLSCSICLLPYISLNKLYPFCNVHIYMCVLSVISQRAFYSFVSFCYLPSLSQFDLNTSGVMFSFFIYLLYLSRNVFINISKERSLEDYNIISQIESGCERNSSLWLYPMILGET